MRGGIFSDWKAGQHLIMRNIKFRVWDGSVFYYPSYELQTTNCDPMGSAGLVMGLGDCAYIDDNAVIQQFTGLKDKKIKEIYEGDLVNFWVKSAANGGKREFYQNQEVYYDEELACFMFGKNYTKTGDIWSHSMLDDIDRETLEVAGNIFENK
jgi:uncharacterized phage protein (TIGR01671 family)